jgi:dipeptidyl aminopeptidase/acylaminoacyl peptidase
MFAEGARIMTWSQKFVVIVALFLASCGNGQTAKAETLAHPDRRGAKIEYFAMKPNGTGPWPTLIFLHGHQDAMSRIGGRAFVDWGVLERYSKRGFLAVSISLPGYAGSSGPEDFAGPFSQHAVQAVVAKLKVQKIADPKRILIEGISLGAVTGALVAAHDRDLAGLVLISGLYDLPSYFSAPKTPAAIGIKLNMMKQTGGSLEALRSRSALFVASDIKANVLILNGAKDDRTDPVQAQRFADAIVASGGHATAHIFSDFGHQIPVKARDPEIDAFVDATLMR